MQAQQRLDPNTIAKLSNLHLKATSIVEGYLNGLHQSPYHGFSVEFSEHRQYMPGDSLRALDYKVLAKTGRYYIKQYEEETNLKAWFLIDHSASMRYSSKSMNSSVDDGLVTKLDYSIALCGALSLLLLKQRDAVGLITFNNKVTNVMPPKSAMGWLDPLLTILDGLNSEGETNVATALFDIAERVKRKGLIVLISDLLEEPNEVLAGLKALKHIGHDVIVFQVLDPFEMNFSFTQDAKFKDLESSEIVPGRPWHLQAEYKKLMKDFIDEYKFRCRQQVIDYNLLTTDLQYGVALFEFLKKRRLLH